MNPRVDDLRHLKLAELHESAYERFVVEVATGVVEDPRIRAALLALAPVGGGHHPRLAGEMARINAELTPAERAEVTRAALLDVVEVERAARDLYLRLADRVHDPRLVRLFRALAKDEERRVRLAQDLVVLADAPPPEPRRVH
ncbi:MAG TPA: hypothetical protein VNX21_01025 [Candidatus Thermoplasmatota archaeon]|nr:hypothetical protein [Candidatus Thermoplasmatota archaeon]